MAETDSSIYYWAHRFIGKIAMRDDREQGRIKIVESYWVKDYQSGVNDGFRTSYALEWQDGEVTKATHFIHAQDVTYLPPERVYHSGTSFSIERARPAAVAGLIIQSSDAAVMELAQAKPVVCKTLPEDCMPSSEPYTSQLQQAIAETHMLSRADCEKLVIALQSFG